MCTELRRRPKRDSVARRILCKSRTRNESETIVDYPSRNALDRGGELLNGSSQCFIAGRTGFRNERNPAKPYDQWSVRSTSGSDGDYEWIAHLRRGCEFCRSYNGSERQICRYRYQKDNGNDGRERCGNLGLFH